jgi:ribonuclease HI
LDYSIPWGYFDGANQGYPPSIGIGVVLFLNQNHYIYIGYAPGGGSNNKAELIALSTLLETTKKNDNMKLQVMGYFKLVIDWAKGKMSIQNIILVNILRDIRLSFQSFEWLSFQHILRELNVKADDLSKEALQLQRGAFRYYEYFEGTET